MTLGAEEETGVLEAGLAGDAWFAAVLKLPGSELAEKKPVKLESGANKKLRQARR